MSDAQSALPNPNPSGQELPPEQSVPIDPASLALHYERDDVSVGAIVGFSVAILAGIVVACLALWLVVRYWTGQPAPLQVQLSPAVVEAVEVPGPGLDAAPEENLDELLRRQSELLTTYGWLDRESGVVHIPIEAAMRLLVVEGVPARDWPAPTFQLEPAFRLDSSGGRVPVGGIATEKLESVEDDE